MSPLFWTAFVLGVAFCAPPGAVTAEALRRGLRRGFAGALLLELGSLVGDAAWAAAALSGVAYLAASGAAAVVLAGLGALLLFHLAWRALRDAWTGAIPEAGRASSGGDFLTGAALSLSNPFAVAFWLGLGGTAAVLGPGRPPQLALFFGAFMFAAFLWCFFIAAMIAWGRRFLSAGFYRCVNVLCGAVLAYFGLRLLPAIVSTAAVFGAR